MWSGGAAHDLKAWTICPRLVIRIPYFPEKVNKQMKFYRFAQFLRGNMVISTEKISAAGGDGSRSGVLSAAGACRLLFVLLRVA